MVKFIKGSEEAKAHMKMLREKRGLKGGAIQAPVSRSPETASEAQIDGMGMKQLKKKVKQAVSECKSCSGLGLDMK